MARKELIGVGVGFHPESVRYIVTRGLLGAQVPVSTMQLAPRRTKRPQLLLLTANHAGSAAADGLPAAMLLSNRLAAINAPTAVAGGAMAQIRMPACLRARGRATTLSATVTVPAIDRAQLEEEELLLLDGFY